MASRAFTLLLAAINTFVIGVYCLSSLSTSVEYSAATSINWDTLVVATSPTTASPSGFIGVASPSITSAPICEEGNNEKMGMDHIPASWCNCAGQGPFSTIQNMTTSYCNFTALPTQTITFTSGPTVTVNATCKKASITLPTPNSLGLQEQCDCGGTIVGVHTTVAATSRTTYTYTACATSGTPTIETVIATPTPAPYCGNWGADLGAKMITTNWQGMSPVRVTSGMVLDSINKYCGLNGTLRSPYTMTTSEQGDGFIVKTAREKFSYDTSDNFCATQANDHGNWTNSNGCTWNMGAAKWVVIQTRWSTDQTSCSAMKDWVVPTGETCSNALGQIQNHCDREEGASANLGVMRVETGGGCIDWAIWSYDNTTFNGTLNELPALQPNGQAWDLGAEGFNGH